MTAQFGMRCGCGRAVFADCPQLDDIAQVQARVTGWGHDARGFVRCPDCLGRPEAATARPAGQGGEQLELLGGAA